MASQEEMKTIAHKMIDDQEFRSQFREDPAATAATMGITLTREQVESITEVQVKAEEAGLRESKAADLGLGLWLG